MLLRTVVIAVALGASAIAGEGGESLWALTLSRFVAPDGRVHYAELRRDGLQPLDAYLHAMAQPWRAMSVDARKAALINSYNALVLRWIALNYPCKSIWETRKPFNSPRHDIDGSKVSLDQIERLLRSTGDIRVIAALSNATLDGPPLRREPYTAARVDDQLDDNLRAWLADSNRNAPAYLKLNDAYLARAGGMQRVVAVYGSPNVPHKTADFRWGLNDASKLGEGYSGFRYWLDKTLNALRR